MKTSSRTLVLVLYLALACLAPAAVSAQSTPPAQTAQLTEYKLLEPLPFGSGGGLTQKVNAPGYIQGLFRLIIALAGVLAVIRLIYAGIIKMSSDAISQQNKARDIISDSIWGLLLALGAWVIVATVLPTDDGRFVFKLDLPTTPIPANTNLPGSGGGSGGDGTLPGYVMTPAQIAEDQATRKRLLDSGIGINAGPCTQGQTRGCTNLNGLPEGTTQNLLTLKSDCGCNVTVTGGTEGGHLTHGPGRTPVDLSYNQSLKNWMISKNFWNTSTNGGIVDLSSGRQMIFVFEPGGVENSTGDHWHIP